VFDAMLEGWRRQSARFLKASTITPRPRLLRRMEQFTNGRWTGDSARVK
jgi:hypothetical protein